MTTYLNVLYTLQSTTHILVLSLPKSSYFHVGGKYGPQRSNDFPRSYSELGQSSLSYLHPSNLLNLQSLVQERVFLSLAQPARAKWPRFASQLCLFHNPRTHVRPVCQGCHRGKERVVTAPGHSGCLIMAVSLCQPSYHSLSCFLPALGLQSRPG